MKIDTNGFDESLIRHSDERLEIVRAIGKHGGRANLREIRRVSERADAVTTLNNRQVRYHAKQLDDAGAVNIDGYDDEWDDEGQPPLVVEVTTAATEVCQDELERRKGERRGMSDEEYEQLIEDVADRVMDDLDDTVDDIEDTVNLLEERQDELVSDARMMRQLVAETLELSLPLVEDSNRISADEKEKYRSRVQRLGKNTRGYD